MAYDYDLTVIGGGPGGYVAAIRAAQLGARTALIEKDKLGGTCLNRGCIPTKALIASTGILNQIETAKNFGVEAEVRAVDFAAMMARKNKIVAQLCNGVAYLMNKNRITVISRQASFFDDHTVGWEGGSLSSERFIIASGSVPKRLPWAKDNPKVVTSDEILETDHIPEKLLVVGGGVIGVEFAGIFNALGSEVTIVEFLDSILANVDRELTARLKRVLNKKGVKILTSHKVEDIVDGTVTVRSEKNGGSKQIEADLILCSTGRAPYLDNLALEKAGVVSGPNGIPVNGHFLTNIGHIAAIGDVLGGIQLAHLASAQGMAAAENLLQGESAVNTSIIPSCIFSSPELATVGLSEEEAAAQGLEWEKAVYPMSALGKAMAMGETDGMVKAVFETKSGTLLGLHILAPHATDLIMEGAVALAKGMTVADLAEIVHPHPTIAESVMEVMHLALKRPVNL